MIEDYINRVDAAIEKALLDTDTKLTEEIFRISGMSSRENRILLNEIVRESDKYLEIGVHRGSTFVSALYKNNATAVSIDNFSQFGGKEIKQWFDQNCNENGITNFTFLDRDCFNITQEDRELIQNTNVYFYDGDHRFEDQKMALTYYWDLLTDPFIFIVDDFSHKPVEDGTYAGIEAVNAKVHKEWKLYRETHNKSWHNGLYIAVLGK